MTPKNRYNTAKYKKGDVIYFKSPSRYSRRKDTNTVEAIIRIKKLVHDNYRNSANYHYSIEILKIIKGKRNHWSNPEAFNILPECVVDSLEIETYSRKLTPAEKVLYA